MLVGPCTNLEIYLFEFSKIINHHQKSFTHYLHSKDFYIILFVWLLKPHDSTHAYLIIIIQITKEKVSQVSCLIGKNLNHFWSSLFVEKMTLQILKEKNILRALRIFFFVFRSFFLEELKIPKIAFEIYWPLVGVIFSTKNLYEKSLRILQIQQLTWDTFSLQRLLLIRHVKLPIM